MAAVRMDLSAGEQSYSASAHVALVVIAAQHVHLRYPFCKRTTSSSCPIAWNLTYLYVMYLPSNVPHYLLALSLNAQQFIWCANCPQGYSGYRCEIAPAGAGVTGAGGAVPDNTFPQKCGPPATGGNCQNGSIC
eukprot:14135-Heterococcus_DN1.PRE.1